jgi:citrate synthase
MSNGFVYQGQMSTRITYEEPLPGNPYLAGERFTHGYAHTELLRHCSYVETLVLLLRGELPNLAEQRLLETLLVGLSNPGPNHPAVRAAMTAGLSKSNSEHLLPLGLLVAGEARTTAAAWDFLQRASGNSALLDAACEDVPPGFGDSFGEPDPLLAQLANNLTNTGNWPTLTWAHIFTRRTVPSGIGWRIPGLVAAVACDLGMDARQSIALYQLAMAPAIVAHGLEQTHQPITAGPMLDDRDYELLPGP